MNEFLLRFITVILIDIFAGVIIPNGKMKNIISYFISIFIIISILVPVVDFFNLIV